MTVISGIILLLVIYNICVYLADACLYKVGACLLGRVIHEETTDQYPYRRFFGHVSYDWMHLINTYFFMLYLARCFVYN